MIQGTHAGKAIHIAHEADTDSKQCGLNEIAKK